MQISVTELEFINLEFFINSIETIFIWTNVINLCFGCVAFLTVIERKVLGYVHISKCPNKFGFIGTLPPVFLTNGISQVIISHVLVANVRKMVH